MKNGFLFYKTTLNDVDSTFQRCPVRRDRFRVVILKLNSKEYIDGVLKSKVNFEFLLNLFVSENDRIH